MPARRTLGTNERHVLWELANREDLEWPVSSGGPEVLAAIVARCRELVADRSARRTATFDSVDASRDPNLGMVDAVLHGLLTPERERQRSGLIAAMQRCIEIIDGSTTC